MNPGTKQSARTTRIFPAAFGCARRSILLFFVLVVAACPQPEPTKYEKVDPRARHIMFSAPRLVDREPVVFVSSGLRSRRETASWNARGASASFWYGSTLGLWRRNQEQMTEETLRGWNALKHEKLEIADGGVVPSRIGAIKYWRFTKGGRQQCFGISHFWTPSVNDSGGYRDWLHGYYCHPAHIPLPDSEIVEMVSRLQVRTKTGDPGSGWRQ